MPMTKDHALFSTLVAYSCGVQLPGVVVHRRWPGYYIEFVTGCALTVPFRAGLELRARQAEILIP
jgi:hypothetical protein